MKWSFSISSIGRLGIVATVFISRGANTGRNSVRRLIVNMDDCISTEKYPGALFFAMMFTFFSAMFAGFTGLSAIVGGFNAGVSFVGGKT